MDRWAKKIESIVKESTEIPMWGRIPDFPWTQFSERLSQGLSLAPLTVSAGTTEWREETQLLSGLGNEAVSLSIELSPIQSSLHLLFPPDDIQRISSWIVGDEGFSDPDLQRGFYHYLSLSALAAVDSLEIFHKLSPKVVESPLPKEASYCIDVAVEYEGKTAWGRLVLPKTFQQAFKTHFQNQDIDLAQSKIAQELAVPLAASAGRLLLTQTELQGLKAGDFVIIDLPYYETYELSLNDHPLFQITPEEGGFKITDFATSREELPMPEAPTPQPEEETPSVSLTDIPIELSVEVARFSMPLAELLAMKPGNVIELASAQVLQVSLTSKGKCVAKGELLDIGDVTGVKLTQVGHG